MRGSKRTLISTRLLLSPYDLTIEASKGPWLVLTHSAWVIGRDMESVKPPPTGIGDEFMSGLGGIQGGR